MNANMNWLKIPALLILGIIFSILGELSMESFEMAQMACYSWSTEVTVSCTIDFLPIGLNQALSQNSLLSIFSTNNTSANLIKPNSGFGNLLFFGTIITEMILLAIMAYIINAFLPKPTEQSRE